MASASSVEILLMYAVGKMIKGFKKPMVIGLSILGEVNRRTFGDMLWLFLISSSMFNHSVGIICELVCLIFLSQSKLLMQRNVCTIIPMVYIITMYGKSFVIDQFEFCNLSI